MDLSRAVWRRSSRSNAGGNCVEVAHAGGSVAVRDSKQPDGGALVVPAAAWRTFLAPYRRDT